MEQTVTVVNFSLASTKVQTKNENQKLTRIKNTAFPLSSRLLVSLYCLLLNSLRPSIKLQILLLCFHTFLTESSGEKLLKYQ